MDLWMEYGFRQNPYATTPVPPTEEGEKLLVGRTRELRQLMLRVANTDTHPTVEGDNGVGKTSLAAVAGYRMLESWKRRETTQLLIPLRDPLQLAPNDSQQTFERQVILRVLQAFIDNKDMLEYADRRLPDLGAVRRWLSAPEYREGQGGVAGFTLGGARSPNESTGFNEQGVYELVRSWLRGAFPDARSGGFVCVLDNLELLETSVKARQLLEAVRDTVFRMPGLRWILCGARGIVRSTVSSQRLQGVLTEPIELSPLPSGLMPSLIQARIDAYAVRRGANPPVDGTGFDRIYRVMNGNLRNTLKLCQDFAVWLLEEGELPVEPEEKLALLEAWLKGQAEKQQEAARSLTPVAWRVFDKLIELGGESSPSDFTLFGYDSSQALRPHVRNLEQANLVDSSIDESDRRRRTTVVTSAGWLVHYSRSGFAEPRITA
ncbi:hypothetical protein ACI792_12960 [Blastococcus sp. SYSU DS0669]